MISSSSSVGVMALPAAIKPQRTQIATIFTYEGAVYTPSILQVFAAGNGYIQIYTGVVPFSSANAVKGNVASSITYLLS
jgi:hypothetical protein